MAGLSRWWPAFFEKVLVMAKDENGPEQPACAPEGAVGGVRVGGGLFKGGVFGAAETRVIGGETNGGETGLLFRGGKAEGNGTMKDVLGGKGAGLAEMTNLGVPVPPGFTISTEACNLYYRHRGKLPRMSRRRSRRTREARAGDRQEARGSEKPAARLRTVGAKFSMPA